MLTSSIPLQLLPFTTHAEQNATIQVAEYLRYKVLNINWTHRDLFQLSCFHYLNSIFSSSLFHHANSRVISEFKSLTKTIILLFAANLGSRGINESTLLQVSIPVHTHLY